MLHHLLEAAILHAGRQLGRARGLRLGLRLDGGRGLLGLALARALRAFPPLRLGRAPLGRRLGLEGRWLLGLLLGYLALLGLARALVRDLDDLRCGGLIVEAVGFGRALEHLDDDRAGQVHLERLLHKVLVDHGLVQRDLALVGLVHSDIVALHGLFR